MTYDKFSTIGGREALAQNRKTVGPVESTRIADSNSAPAIDESAVGKWVRLDPNGRVVDTDLSADALLQRYSGADRPRIAFLEGNDELIG